MKFIIAFLCICLFSYAKDNFEDLLFAKNDALMCFLLNDSNSSLNELNRQKELYLKSIADDEMLTGLYIKGSGKKNFTKDRLGYDVKLEWNIFDDGYIGLRRDMRKKVVQKELEFEQNIIKYKNLNLQLALYELDIVSNYIDYLSFKSQENIFLQNYQKAQQEYNASMITASKFYEFKNRYEKSKRMLLYYKNLKLKPYDLKLKSFISSIENIVILNKKTLIDHALKNAYLLRSIQNKIAMTNLDDDWKDRLKASIFVENKKYLFLEDSDSEMIAGVQLQIPLDFRSQNSQSRIIEKNIYKLQEENTKKLIVKNIEKLYHKIDYYKNYIKLLKNEMKMLQQEKKSLFFKLKYSLLQQKRDISNKLRALDIKIIKQFQEIWQKRTKILKLVLKLQNVSGEELLLDYINSEKSNS